MQGLGDEDGACNAEVGFVSDEGGPTEVGGCADTGRGVLVDPDGEGEGVDGRGGENIPFEDTG